MNPEILFLVIGQLLSPHLTEVLLLYFQAESIEEVCQKPSFHRFLLKEENHLTNELKLVMLRYRYEILRLQRFGEDGFADFADGLLAKLDGGEL